MRQNANIGILIAFFIFALIPYVNATTSLIYQYDANGDLIQGDGKHYEYNDANQLVRVRHGDQTGPVIAEYFYDYTGQRIKKIENGITTYYIGKHYETQVNGDNQNNTSYYFANGERVAKKDSSGNIYYYHLDHLGGTNVVTDSAGNLVERTKYYPFGEIREGGNEKYSFTGKEKDKLTEFYYFEARYYGPEFKHFSQADVVAPNLYDPQDLNRYSYVRNNPLRYIDPTGRVWWNPFTWFKKKENGQQIENASRQKSTASQQICGPCRRQNNNTGVSKQVYLDKPSGNEKSLSDVEAEIKQEQSSREAFWSAVEDTAEPETVALGVAAVGYGLMFVPVPGVQAVGLGLITSAPAVGYAGSLAIKGVSAAATREQQGTLERHLYYRGLNVNGNVNGPPSLESIHFPEDGGLQPAQYLRLDGSIR